MDIESVSVFRLIGSIDPEAIELARGDTANPHVPDITCSMSCRIQIDRPGGRTRIRASIELQANASRMTAEQREIDSSLALVCPKWQGASGTNFHARLLEKIGPTVFCGRDTHPQLAFKPVTMPDVSC